MDVALILDFLLPGANYRGSLTANTQASYDALEWSDDRSKPTWAQLQEAWADYSPTIQIPLPEIQFKREQIRQLFKGASLSLRDQFASVMAEIFTAMEIGDVELAQFKIVHLDLSNIADPVLLQEAEALKVHLNSIFQSLLGAV